MSASSRELLLLGGAFGLGALALSARKLAMSRRQQRELDSRYSAEAGASFLSAAEIEAKKNAPSNPRPAPGERTAVIERGY